MTPRFGLPAYQVPKSQLIVGLILAVIIVTMAILQSQPQIVEPYDPDNSGSNGLRALALWLEELGHPVTIGVPRAGLPNGPGLLWIHPSVQGDPDYYSDVDVALTESWVHSGGTLALIGPIEGDTPLGQYFGIEQIEDITGAVLPIRQVQPLLPDIDTEWESFFTTHSLRYLDQRNFVPLLAQVNGNPVVALQFIGEGVVWHLTEEFALTNLTLRDERIASLLPAMLRTVPGDAPVIFSTHHLASYNLDQGDLGTVSTLQDWLYTTPFGQGVLVTMIVVFVFLLLQGRRLGPPLPALTATRPREAAEYVIALAGLQRRTRQPRVVAEHHRQRLKNAIGRLAQAPADLPDADWLAQLRRAEILTLDMLYQVEELLKGYAQANDEADLIHLLQTTDALLASLPRAQTYSTHTVR